MFLNFGILLLLSQGLLGEVDVSKDGDSRIIGGQDASPGMAKYQVSIHYHRGEQEWYICGGSIIKEECVLTSANCVFRKRPDDLSLVAGSHQINKGGERYKIKNFIRHEDYSSWTLKNDIAIVQIKGKFKFSDKVQPIELLKEMVPIGKKCLLTGWGYVDYDKKTLANNLQMLEFQTISNDDCTKQLKPSPRPTWVPVNAGQLCAHSPKNKSACIGDSGSPLVIRDDKNKTLQIGVYSWGIPCATNFPDVFASIHGHYNWIQRIIKRNIK